jgi:hypothetical protein
MLRWSLKTGSTVLEYMPAYLTSYIILNSHVLPKQVISVETYFTVFVCDWVIASIILLSHIIENTYVQKSNNFKIKYNVSSMYI